MNKKTESERKQEYSSSEIESQMMQYLNQNEGATNQLKDLAHIVIGKNKGHGHQTHKGKKIGTESEAEIMKKQIENRVSHYPDKMDLFASTTKEKNEFE